MADQALDQVIDTSNVFQSIFNRSQGPRNPKRESWVFDSSYSRSHGIRPIAMTVNPTSVRFNQSKRTSTGKKTIGGTTYFHWSDKTGRNLDQLVLDIQGETGPVSGLGANQQLQDATSLIKVNGQVKGTKAYENGRNWARLYTLTTQPQINPVTFEPTIWYIRYKSLIFPDILFSGFFNEVMHFTDDAMNPFSKKYSLKFTVLGDTSPSILELMNLIGEDDVNLLAKSDKTAVRGVGSA